MLIAQQGASLKDLMARAGHSTVRAAMIYQHAAEEGDADLAARWSDQPPQARTTEPRQGLRR